MTTISVQMEQELEIPRPPNFIRRAGDDKAIPVADLSDDAIEAIIEAWGQALRDKVANDRAETMGRADTLMAARLLAEAHSTALRGSK